MMVNHLNRKINVCLYTFPKYLILNIIKYGWWIICWIIIICNLHKIFNMLRKEKKFTRRDCLCSFKIHCWINGHHESINVIFPIFIGGKKNKKNPQLSKATSTEAKNLFVDASNGFSMVSHRFIEQQELQECNTFAQPVQSIGVWMAFFQIYLFPLRVHVRVFFHSLHTCTSKLPGVHVASSETADRNVCSEKYSIMC